MRAVGDRGRWNRKGRRRQYLKDLYNYVGECGLDGEVIGSHLKVLKEEV